VADKQLVALNRDSGVVSERAELAMNHLIQFIGGVDAEVALQIGDHVTPAMNVGMAAIYRDGHEMIAVAVIMAIMAGVVVILRPRPTMIGWLLYFMFVLHIFLHRSWIDRPPIGSHLCNAQSGERSDI
jgi:hypothetical protein